MKGPITAVRLLAVAASLVLGSTAYAGFTNGGFEDGTFSGWTVQQGFDNFAAYYSSAPGTWGQSNPLDNVVWGQQNYWSPAPAPVIVDKAGYSDPYFAAVQGMFLGNKMAKLNDIDGYFHVTQISQTGTIDASDLAPGATTADVYINWAGITDDPSHGGGNDPWFIIDVFKNGSAVPTFEERHFSHEGGWNDTSLKYPLGSVYGDPVYFKSGQFHVGGLVVGDSVEVVLTVSDCAWGGHGAYAYLDGLGTSQPPQPPGAPDGGATALLLVPVLAGLVALRRKLS